MESKIRWIDIEPTSVTIIIGLLAFVVLRLGSVILILPFVLSILGLVTLNHFQDFIIPTGHLVFFRTKIDDKRICEIV